MKRSGLARVLRSTNRWQMPRHWLRLTAMAVATIVFLGLLSQRLATLDLAEVIQAFSAVSIGHWAMALCATAVSFWAIGQYDACLHRHLATGCSDRQARHAGVAAIALGQTLGLGVLTGALVRWRMLPQVSLITATKLSGAVALSFLFGWSMVTGLVLLGLPAAPLKPLALMTCAAGAVFALLCLWQPRLRLFGRKLSLPNIFTLWQILIFSLVDTFAAAFALWLLCPPELILPFATLLPAYLLALGAGLISGTPGGVGAFEMTLLAALPMVPEPALIAGVLAFRLAYYALPAVLAAYGALRVPLPPHSAANLAPRALPDTAPAEAGLIRQKQINIVDILDTSQALIGETSHSLVMLLDPFGPAAPQETLCALRAMAKDRTRVACLYKCGPRMAAAARIAGWQVASVAAEAWLDPTVFSTDGAAKSALRRKLRKAEKAGVSLRELTPEDAQDLPQIACEWAQDNGGERGFSMGRFAPTHIAAQRVFGAFVQGRIIAFISFHHNNREWVLDLMRHRNATPDGTNYALVSHAIQVAAGLGITRFSLAAAPRPPEFSIWFGRFFPVPNGLCQFKSRFAPRWHPLYIAAPNRAALALAAAEIYREIHAPPPLICDPAHNHPAQNKIASQAQSWQMGGK